MTVAPYVFFKKTVTPYVFFKTTAVPLTFFQNDSYIFFKNDIKKRQCYPLRFFQKDSHPLRFFKTTVLPLIYFFQNDWWKTSYPVFFYSQRQINNDSVTPYVFFQNDSVTHWFFSKQQINNSVTLTFFFKTTILPLKFFFKTTDNTRQCYALGLYVPLMSS